MKRLFHLVLILLLFFSCTTSKDKVERINFVKLKMRVGIWDIQDPIGSPLSLYQEESATEVKISFQPQSSPTYGFLHFNHPRDGHIKIIYLFEKTDEGKENIYFDSNQDSDLTKNEKLKWQTRVKDEEEFQFFTAPINIRFKKNEKEYDFTHYINIEKWDGKRAWQYKNCYRTGKIKLGRKKVKIALVDETWDGLYDDWKQDALIIDIDGDGKLEGNMDSHEYFKLNETFRFEKLTYRVEELSPLGDWIQIVISEKPANFKHILDVGYPAPNFTVQDIYGRTIKLEGKVTLLDFWATWCGPCKPMIPNLKEINREFEDENFLLVGISLDQDLEKLKEFIKNNGITWPQYCDGNRWDNKIAKLYRIIGTGIPFFYLIDKKGKIRFKGRDDTRLVEMIRELVEE